MVDRRLPPEHQSGIRRVQVGCGPKHFREDWWNTDLRPFPRVDELMDAAKEWRWKDRIEFVYAEHFLEHLDLEDAVSFLSYAGQALVKGGRIRLSTPGLEWVMKTHFTFATPDSPKHLSDTLATNRAFHGWGHRFLYSKGMLQWLIESLGFEAVEFFRYGESNTAALRNLELHGSYSVVEGFPSVWIIEGERGDQAITPSTEMQAFLEEGFIRYVRSGH